MHAKNSMSVSCVPFQGHFELPPYTESSMRSAYHIRELDVYRLLQLRQPLDVFLSHDWPSRIADHGNKAQLCRFKKFLAKEVGHIVQQHLLKL